MSREVCGVGTDIVECARIARMIDRHGGIFLKRVYTRREIAYCQARKRCLEHYAARWAAKEAVLKAIGSGWSRGIRWLDVEVRNEAGGRPHVALRGRAKEIAQRDGVTEVLLSLSHTTHFAVASCVAIRRAVKE